MPIPPYPDESHNSPDNEQLNQPPMQKQGQQPLISEVAEEGSLVDDEGTLFAYNEHLGPLEGLTENIVDRPLKRVKGVFSPADGLSLAVVDPDERSPADWHNTFGIRTVLFNNARPRGVQRFRRYDTHPDSVCQVLGCVPIKPVIRHFPHRHASSIRPSSRNGNGWSTPLNVEAELNGVATVRTPSVQWSALHTLAASN